MKNSIQTKQGRPEDEQSSGGLCLPEYAFITYFERGYRDRPSKPAVIGTGESITYAESFLRAKALAWYLENELAIGPDSTVALSSTNVVDQPIVLAAIQACGASLVLIAGESEPFEYVSYAHHVTPDLFIVSKAQACKLLSDAYPTMYIMTMHCECAGYPSLESVIAEHRIQGISYRAEILGDPRIILFSSGSTGAPKAIVNRSSSFWHNGSEVARAYRITNSDILYLPVPFFHSYGMIGLYSALTQGASIVTLVKYRPETSLSTIESTRATVYFGVPTMYMREMRVNADNEWDISSLRVAKLAGAPCPESVVHEFERRYDCKMLASYGMTETAATLTASDYDAPLEIRATSVGRPIDGATIKIDPNTGELLCKSISMMDGILCKDGSLDPSLDKEGWFHSGDIAEKDDQGNYYIVGRIKDMIIRGGVNIFPLEVENVYQQHEAVSESCLIGYPDPELGERTCLCVVLREGFDELAQDLRCYAFGKLEKCKVPDVVISMPSLPALPNGKTDKGKLRALINGMMQRNERS